MCPIVCASLFNWVGLFLGLPDLCAVDRAKENAGAGQETGSVRSRRGQGGRPSFLIFKTYTESSRANHLVGPAALCIPQTILKE